jgi:hypothetical protein
LFNHQDAIRSFNRIKGLEPTRVMHPPITAQNPMGIKIFETGTFTCRHILFVAGKKSAAAPIFCIKLEINATVAEIRAMIRTSLFPASLMICLAKIFMTPVLSRPSPMMITAMIETTALELKPLMAWEASITPDRGKRTIIRRPTISTLTTSNTNSIVTKTKNPNTIIISEVISRGGIIFTSLFVLTAMVYYVCNIAKIVKDLAVTKSREKAEKMAMLSHNVVKQTFISGSVVKTQHILDMP